jgi:hypothetical protein
MRCEGRSDHPFAPCPLSLTPRHPPYRRPSPVYTGSPFTPLPVHTTPYRRPSPVYTGSPFTPLPVHTTPYRRPSPSQVLQPGSYVLSVTLKSYHIKESPFNIVAGSGFFSDVLAGLPAPPPPWIPTGEGYAFPRPTCTGALSGTRATAAPAPPRLSRVLATPAVPFARDGAPSPRPASPRPAPPRPAPARPASPRPASPRPALDASPRSPDRVLQLASAQLEAIRRRAALNGLGMPSPVTALVEALDAALGPASLDRPTGDAPQRPGAKAVPSPLRQFEASVAAAGTQMSLADDH